MNGSVCAEQSSVNITKWYSLFGVFFYLKFVMLVCPKLAKQHQINEFSDRLTRHLSASELWVSQVSLIELKKFVYTQFSGKVICQNNIQAHKICSHTRVHIWSVNGMEFRSVASARAQHIVFLCLLMCFTHILFAYHMAPVLFWRAFLYYYLLIRIVGVTSARPTDINLTT